MPVGRRGGEGEGATPGDCCADIEDPPRDGLNGAIAQRHPNADQRRSLDNQGCPGNRLRTRGVADGGGDGQRKDELGTDHGGESQGPDRERPRPADGYQDYDEERRGRVGHRREAVLREMREAQTHGVDDEERDGEGGDGLGGRGKVTASRDHGTRTGKQGHGRHDRRPAHRAEDAPIDGDEDDRADGEEQNAEGEKEVLDPAAAPLLPGARGTRDRP